MRKGFTLVELSIVLVIIGLLIGGILVGQSLISSAKIMRIVKDLEQYEIAVNNFRMNYKYYPGDAPNFSPPGNGNSIMDGNNSCPFADPTISNYEPGQMWAHLSQANMIKTQFALYSPDFCGGSHNTDYNMAAANHSNIAPSIDIDNNASDYLNNYAYSGIRAWGIQGAKSAVNTNFYFILMLSTLDTLAVESKMGAKAYANNRQVGLTNSYGLKNCLDINAATIPCSDSTAMIGTLYYFLAP